MVRVISFLTLLSALSAVSCGPRALPPGTPEQSVHDAMVLVCDAPRRAGSDRARGGGVSRADAVAAHLSDGVGNGEVLTTIEGWKTDGVNMAELDRLLSRAGIGRRQCALRDQ